MRMTPDGTKWWVVDMEGKIFEVRAIYGPYTYRFGAYIALRSARALIGFAPRRELSPSRRVGFRVGFICQRDPPSCCRKNRLRGLHRCFVYDDGQTPMPQTGHPNIQSTPGFRRAKGTDASHGKGDLRGCRVTCTTSPRAQHHHTEQRPPQAIDVTNNRSRHARAVGACLNHRLRVYQHES